MASNQVEKLSSPAFILPEPEHNAWEGLHYGNKHLLAWILAALGSAGRVVSGRINAGQIENLAVLFCLSDGTSEIVSFPTTPISVGATRKIYYADYTTQTILSVDIPGFDNFTPDEMQFPIVHAVRYQDTPLTTADKLEWIAPRLDITPYAPVGEIMAVHPDSPTPDPYFFKLCDGTGLLGDKFPGHENDPVPDLTDDRFLMGGTVYGVGGANTIPDHTHGHSLIAAGQDGGSHYHLVASSGFTGAGNLDSSNYVADRGTKSGQEYFLFGNSSSAPTLGRSTSESHTHNDSAVTGAIGSGSTPSSTTFLPKYFKVKFFLRYR